MSLPSPRDSQLEPEILGPLASRRGTSLLASGDVTHLRSTYSLPYEITRCIFKFYHHSLPLLDPNPLSGLSNRVYYSGVIDFGAVCKQWRNVSLEAESYTLDSPTASWKLISMLEGRNRPATNIQRLSCDNLQPDGVAPLCELLRLSRRSLVTAHFWVNHGAPYEERLQDPSLLFKNIGEAIELNRLHLSFRGVGPCDCEFDAYQFKVEDLHRSLRHFSLDNCFSSKTERFDEEKFFSSTVEPWHTITHLTVSASYRSIALTTDLIAAGTVTHFTFRQASTFSGAAPLAGALLELRSVLCTHAHRLVELKFSHFIDYHYHKMGDQEYAGEDFNAFLEPVIPLLTSCERLVLLSNHVKALSSLHLPHLPKIQHITIMGLAFNDDSEDLQQLADFVTQHVGTLKTLRTTPYRDSDSKTKYIRLDDETRQKTFDLGTWSIENSIQIRLDDFEYGSEQHDISPWDEDVYLGKFEHSTHNFDKYYFDGHRYNPA